MRREELIRAVENIRKALKASGLRLSLEEIFGHRDSQKFDPVVYLKAFKEYSIVAEGFGPAERELIGILDLQSLEEMPFWSSLFGPDEAKRTTETYKVLNRVIFAEDNLPKISRMVQQKALLSFAESAAQPGSFYHGKELLSVIMIEEGPVFSTPIRLSEVLVSVSLLYEASAIIEEIRPEGLSVVACDSGSDKSFDFLGIAKVIECVKGIILSLWDRIVFYRERKFEAWIDLIAKQLPIFDKIGDLEQQQKLSPEQAELLRRQINDGVTKFISCGAIIPEIERTSSFNPRVLMAPEPKLITSPSDIPSPSGPVARKRRGRSKRGDKKKE